jgi:hypothetical protein
MKENDKYRTRSMNGRSKKYFQNLNREVKIDNLPWETSENTNENIIKFHLIKMYINHIYFYKMNVNISA